MKIKLLVISVKVVVTIVNHKISDLKRTYDSYLANIFKKIQGGNELYQQTIRGCSGMFAECFDVRNPWSLMAHYRII